MLGTIFILIGVFLIIINWLIVYYALVHKKHSSIIPIFGGGAVSIGLILLGEPFNFYWWLPLLLDYGTIPLLVHTAYFFIFQKDKHSK